MMSENELAIQIKDARKKMHEIWNKRGYTDKDVLEASVKLDDLLNQYQKIRLFKSRAF